MIYLKKAFTIAILLVLYGASFANSPSMVFNGNTLTIDGRNIEYLEDKTDTLSFNGVFGSGNFQPCVQIVPNFGVTSSSFWVRFKIINHSDNASFLLELQQSFIDEVELYSKSDSGKVSIQRMGENKVFSARKYNYPDYLFDLNINMGDTATYYMKVKSGEQILLPMKVSTSWQIFQSFNIKDLIFGIYSGLILVMFLYNLFIYYSLRDKSYLLYVIYILFVGLTQANLLGYGFKYLWSDYPWFAIQSSYMLPSWVGFTLIPFVMVFLQTKKNFPVWHKIMFAPIILYAVCIIAALLKQYSLSYKLVQLNGTLTALILLIVGIAGSVKGNRSAKFFVIAWFMFLVGVVFFALKDFGVLPYSILTIYTMPAGSAIEVVLLSFALADRINILRTEKEEAQAFALVEEQKLVDVIRTQNVVLETKVKERTKELEDTNSELSTTLVTLKQTQSQLIDAEKMASLGQLTAGIAHEINNPINFVLSNVKPLGRDIEDLVSVIKKYDEVKADGNVAAKLLEINKFKTKLDLNYTYEEINNLLKGIGDGATRTSEIVRGLKNFSRLDEDTLKQADIMEGIDSTLILLNSQIKDRINVVKAYGELPKIDCYPGKLNQVFMNILNNAIQSILSSENKGRGVITITTGKEDGKVKVSFKDNGHGISPEHRNRIFEPFFTTKDVGAGLGMGLAIAYNIIEKHKGKIVVSSEPGQGAEFTITLPVSQ